MTKSMVRIVQFDGPDGPDGGRTGGETFLLLLSYYLDLRYILELHSSGFSSRAEDTLALSR